LADTEVRRMGRSGAGQLQAHRFGRVKAT